MKPNIHPEYKAIKVTCSCGHVFTVGSALGKDLHIEVCNECHPFYTGKQKIVDTAGRVERFKGKFGAFSLQKGAADADAPKASHSGTAGVSSSSKVSGAAASKPSANKAAGSGGEKKKDAKQKDKKSDEKKK